VFDEVILAWLEKPTQRTVWIDNPDSQDAPKIALPVEPFHSNWEEVTITDVLLHAVGKDLKNLTQADRNQAGRCLTHAGWKVGRKRLGKGQPRFYARPKEE
jgi:hypothetical protein